MIYWSRWSVDLRWIIGYWCFHSSLDDLVIIVFLLVNIAVTALFIIFWTICILEMCEGPDHLGERRHKGKFPRQSSSLLSSNTPLWYLYWSQTFICNSNRQVTPQPDFNTTEWRKKSPLRWHPRTQALVTNSEVGNFLHILLKKPHQTTVREGWL